MAARFRRYLGFLLGPYVDGVVGAPVIASQEVLEALTTGTPEARGSQTSLETVSTGIVVVRGSQSVLEVLHNMQIPALASQSLLEVTTLGHPAAASQVLLETITLNPSTSTRIARDFEDSITLSDEVTEKRIELVLNDTLTLTDSFDRVAGFLLELADVIELKTGPLEPSKGFIHEKRKRWVNHGNVYFNTKY